MTDKVVSQTWARTPAERGSITSCVGVSMSFPRRICDLTLPAYERHTE